MTEHEEKNFSKRNSIDLDTRARVTFAATAEDIDDEEGNSGTRQESVNDQELKSYLEEVMSQVRKKKEEKETSMKVKGKKKNQAE